MPNPYAQRDSSAEYTERNNFDVTPLQRSNGNGRI